MKIIFRKTAHMLSVLSLLTFAAMPTTASAELSSEVRAKAEKYVQRLQEWAKHPTVVSAIKAANKGDGLPGMTNSKWEGLAATDPLVADMQANPLSALLSKWEEDSGINKLFARDEKGNAVGYSKKPLLYNVAARPAFANAIKGAPWIQGEVKPDPTTQIESVQVSVPVMDGGKPIGILQSSVTVQ